MNEQKDKLLLVRCIDQAADPKDTANKKGMVFMLTDDGKFKDDLVDAMLVKVDAATLPDGRTTIVTALLRNNFIITETSTCVNKDNYDMDVAVELCMPRIKAKIKDYLAFLWCSASVSVEQLIEFDKIASGEDKDTVKKEA